MIRVFLSKYALPTTVATLSIMIFIRVFFFSENALVDVTFSSVLTEALFSITPRALC